MSDSVRVLHVEDDEGFADLTVTALERESPDLTVTSVGRVDEARERLDDATFDCVVCDYDLPDDTGLDLLGWLRERDDQLPFILFTAKGSEEIASEAVSAGVSDYIQKSGGLDQFGLLAHRVENVVSRHRTERALEQLHRVNEIIRDASQDLVRADTREEIDRLVCETLAASDPYRFAWIGEHDSEADVVVPRASAGIEMDYLDEADLTIDPSVDDGPLTTAVLSGSVQTVQDVRNDESLGPWRERVLDRGYRSIAVIPFVHDETAYGMLTVYAGRPNAFDDRELAVLSELGDTVAYAFRTIEVREKLTTSERNYREIFENVNDAIFVHDIETGAITDVNRKACEMLGYERSELAEMSVGEFSRGAPPYTQEQAVDWIRTAATAGPQLFEWAARRADGTDFWMEVNLKRTVIGGQDRMLAVIRDVTQRKSMEAKLAANREKIEGLLAAVSRMETCETEADVYEMAVEAAEGVLAFDICGINVARDEYFEMMAVSEEMPPDGTHRMRIEEGVAGEVYRTGESRLVDDVQEHDPAKPAQSAYRSNITVPVGDDGVFQAVSEEAGFFDHDDLELAELLVSHVREALERVRSRQAVAANEEKFRELFHSANDAIFLIDVTGDSPAIVEVNDVACDRLGYDREALLGMNPYDLHPEESISEGADSFLELRTVTFESVHQTSDGSEIPVEINAHRFEFDGGDNVLAIARDVSDRREREETLDALHAATRRLIRADDAEAIATVAVEAAKDALAIPLACVLSYDEQREILEPLAATDEMVALFDGRENLTWERGEGLPWRAFDSGEKQHYPPTATRDEFRASVEDVGSAIDLPLGRHGVFMIGSMGHHRFDEADVEFAEILAANTEVALDREARERQLRERERELREQRDQLAALFENIPDPAVSTRFEDGEPIVTRANSTFAETFGIPADEMVGKNLDEHIVPTDPETKPVRLNQWSEEGRVVREEVERETTYGLRDFLLHGVPIDIGESNSRAFGIYTDITEQKRREQELERQNEQLEAFASIVSHDLRNPLNIASGYLELAREEGGEAHFERVEAAHDRMDRLIQGVLALARGPQPAAEAGSIDLDTAVEAAWTHVETGSATLSVEGDLPEVSGDEERVVRLFENLFRNSVEHAGSGVAVRVGATDAVSRSEATGGSSERSSDGGFFVADDGPGIPEPDREAVFEFGHTSHDDGTGFGLAIVERIVAAHDWSIAVTEAEDGGARFEIDV